MAVPAMWTPLQAPRPPAGAELASHLDVFEYQTILHAEPPRCNCEEHGVQVVNLPWAEKGSRFTAFLERWAIRWLQMASQSAVPRQLDLASDEVHAIQQRAVKRGLKRRKIESVPVIGIDEKAYKKGHRYLTLVYDHANSRVLYVGDERKESSLQATGCALGLRGKVVWKPYRILASPDSSKLIRSAPCPMREYAENEDNPAISRDSDQF